MSLRTNHQGKTRNSYRNRTFVGVAGLFALLTFIAIWSTWRIPYAGSGSNSFPTEGDSASRDVDLAPESSLNSSTGSSTMVEESRQPVNADSTSEPERRLIIRDVDGRELNHENGEFVLAPHEGAKIRVSFRDGRFSLSGVSEGMARIEGAMAQLINGNRPIAFQEESFELKLDKPTLLLGHFLPDCTLRVVDANTGIPLNSVSVLPGSAGVGQGHPGPHLEASFVVRDEASPVRLPRLRGVHPYWVTARDYGWSPILVDHETGGERFVQIEPAGRLVVEVYGDIATYMDQSLLVYIRVYYHATRSVLTSSSLEPTGWQGFDGVAVGTYDVKVEVGSVNGSPIVLGETQVDVVAKGTATARIELTSQEVLPSKNRVSGEIVLPKKSRKNGLFLSQRIQPANGRALRAGDAIRMLPPHEPYRYRDAVDIMLGAMKGRYDDDDGNEVFRWETELSSGQYLFIVEPIYYGVLFEVPPSSDVISIVVPELFTVDLRAIDAETRRPIKDATIYWSRQLMEAPEGWIEMGVDPVTESATVYLTEGRFSFGARSPNYGERSMEAYSGPGVSQFTIELSPCIVREIILMQGDAVVPWAEGVTCSFRRLGVEGAQLRASLADGRMQAYFGQPGSYEIIFDKLEWGQELAPVVVSVNKGDLSPIIVHLER